MSDQPAVDWFDHLPALFPEREIRLVSSDGDVFLSRHALTYTDQIG